jgi:cell volume regulation protein A
VTEPFATAILFAVVGGLFAASALLSRATQRLSVPVPLLFILLGVLAGSEAIGRIPFEDYRFAFRAGTAALVLILFDGGFNTSLADVRRVAAPAGLLASVGVVVTAGIVALFARLLGLDWPAALLLGAVVSSTDAAAVFAVLRSSGTELKHRIARTLEVESGVNDPVAFMLTVMLTENLMRPHSISAAWIALEVARTLVVGGALGFGVGWAARRILARMPLAASGLYPVFTLAVAFLAFALPTLLGGSGFLSVYVAAVVLGAGRLPNRTSLLRVHDALAWLSQVAMFLMLGLLVFPSRLLNVAPVGLLLALGLAFLARPIATTLCLLPFRYRVAELVHVGWVGLRGAVPIILATYPVLAGARGAERMFDIVYFIEVVNALVPGATVPWITRRLGLEREQPPPPQAVLRVESDFVLESGILSFYVDEALPVAGIALVELEFPESVAVTMIVRGRELIAPKGDTILRPGDHVYVVASEKDQPFLQLMFGNPEAE